MLFTVLTILVSLLMIGVVLIQNPKGGGINSSVASANQLGGVKRSTEGIEKITWVLAIVIVLVSLASSWSTKKAPTVQQETSQPSILEQ